MEVRKDWRRLFYASQKEQFACSYQKHRVRQKINLTRKLRVHKGCVGLLSWEFLFEFKHFYYFPNPEVGIAFTLSKFNSFQINIKGDVSSCGCCKKLCLFLLGKPRYQISENLQTSVFLRHLLVKTSKVSISPTSLRDLTLPHTFSSLLDSLLCKRLTVIKYLIHRFLH